MELSFSYLIDFRTRILKILNMQQIGRNFYNPNDPLDIPQHRLTIWSGYTSTILPYESAIMMCTDVSHRVLRSETVLDFMINLRQQCGSHNFIDICTKELIGLIILTKYNNKTYRIDDIAWDHTPSNTFTRGETNISFRDYYKNQYGVEITDGNQALLVSHVKRLGPSGSPPRGPAMLLPELCYLTGLTDKMRSDFNIMRDLSVHTRLTPEQRRATAQQIYVKHTEYEYDPVVADWTREMRGVNVISAPPLENWLLFYTRRNTNEAQNLLQNLHKVAGPLGITLQRAKMIEYEDQQDSLLKAMKQNVGPRTQMVVVVLPSSRKDKYDNIKKYLCVDCPVPSQCVVSRTLSRPKALMTVATKIALQMACKMGGELWSVEIPLKHLMIVGIDCYHDTSAGKRSIGALVASLNQRMSRFVSTKHCAGLVHLCFCCTASSISFQRWFSRCVLQHKGQEIMDGLKSPFIAALKEYLKCNNCLPSRIIVYRDGVGDGQLLSVATFEVAQILESIKSLGADYAPKLSVVVVKKRIASRFFSVIGGKMSNPLPGTVIDTEVTRPEWYDFYIVSQAVRSGSVSPTHYNVIHDSSGLKPDHMQRLTYKLCHMYYNWQGVIRVPAPCQYAHKLAFLVGQSIHKEPNMQLDNLLFYL
ncbi:hypothetical protein fugu_004438 [Takifugu bimaculatus]|uniref:Piwi-like protein 1 n=1 Tax=Takifugu bimaculatus TaxID=433685 RepID=A0A4Z2BCP9_9TELE|nr:hypothetical protein fugu_004438 [Takifugu bimaculatus]